VIAMNKLCDFIMLLIFSILTIGLVGILAKIVATILGLA